MEDDFEENKPFEERNQTDQARRKLKNLAKSSSLDLELVTALANFTWDYDIGVFREPIGWVDNSSLPQAAEKQLEFIADVVNLPTDFLLEYDQAANELIQTHAKLSPDLLWTNFYTAVVNKNYSRVSEFASWYYLHGLNKSRIKSLEWRKKRLGIVEIARNLFLKVFRGGNVDRIDLDYLWCDLNIPLQYNSPNSSKNTTWIRTLLTHIEALPSNSRLTDLLTCCKGVVSGDKYFKQLVLEALTFADVLRVNDLQVTQMYLPERRNELSAHFYSNEWYFPLRFWSTNGGTVNRKAIHLP